MIIDHLKANVKNLDGDLSQSDQADLTAFRTLVQTSLEPASLCTMWLETESYSTYTQVTAIGVYEKTFRSFRLRLQCLPAVARSNHQPDTQAKYGQGLPFPLSFVLPRIQQFHVRQKLRHTTPEQVSQMDVLLLVARH